MPGPFSSSIVILTQLVSSSLAVKYDSLFNFFFAKPTNEIVFNQTTALNTIHFKDVTILSETNQYLKRYYFLKNSQDKDEIYDRINLLAEFYSNAVLLRYEYPLMIITRTRSVWMKRLKRMKKIMVQEGSSDQSKEEGDEKVVSLNSQLVLQSLPSSELQKKSIDLQKQELSEFSLLNDDDLEIHDCFAQAEESILLEESEDKEFLHTINRLSKEISQEMIFQVAKNEEQIQHLVIDFQEDDWQQINKKYAKLMQKQNRWNNILLKNAKEAHHNINQHVQSPKGPFARQPGLRVNSPIHQIVSDRKSPPSVKFLPYSAADKKPLTSSIKIVPLEQNATFSQKQQLAEIPFKKKSMMSPSYPTEQDQIRREMKRSSIYHYEEAEDRKINRNSRKNQGSDGDEFGLYSESGQNINYPPTQTAFQKPPTIYDSSGRKQDHNIIPATQYTGFGPQMKYSSILNGDQIKRERFREQRFHSNNYQSHDFLEKEYLGAIDPVESYRYPQIQSQFPYGKAAQTHQNEFPNPNRMTSINININNLEQKKDPISKINVKVSNARQEEVFDGKRAEKKRLIREKAAALLNRVKSQEYLAMYDQEQAKSKNQYQKRKYF